jgi:hypothetical protein
MGIAIEVNQMLGLGDFSANWRITSFKEGKSTN